MEDGRWMVEVRVQKAQGTREKVVTKPSKPYLQIYPFIFLLTCVPSTRTKLAYLQTYPSPSISKSNAPTTTEAAAVLAEVVAAAAAAGVAAGA